MAILFTPVIDKLKQLKSKSRKSHSISTNKTEKVTARLDTQVKSHPTANKGADQGKKNNQGDQ